MMKGKGLEPLIQLWIVEIACPIRKIAAHPAYNNSAGHIRLYLMLVFDIALARELVREFTEFIHYPANATNAGLLLSHERKGRIHQNQGK